MLWPYLHGDQAVIRSGLAERALLSKGLEDVAFDLVHCNHFFLMPVAKRLSRGGARILLDSHDLQARQFALMNEHMPWLRPRVSYEAMLAQELAFMREADLLIHLNAREEAEFRASLPEKTHALLYPAVPPAPTGPGGEDIVIVSSNNSANVDSVIWFLREIAPRAEGVRVKIAGNVDAGVRSRDGALFERYKNWFLGRVENPGAIYAGARLVLLPTIDGHGLSIKTVEAMASGLPLIATRLALRGMGDGRADAGGRRRRRCAGGFRTRAQARPRGKKPGARRDARPAPPGPITTRISRRKPTSGTWKGWSRRCWREDFSFFARGRAEARRGRREV